MEVMPFSSGEQILISLLLLTTTGIFAWTFYQRLKIVFKGKSDRPRLKHLPRRLWVAVKEVFFQTRVLSGRPVAGAMHAAVFGGFVFFALETTDHFLKVYGIHFLRLLFGEAVPVYKGIVDLWAVLVSIGIVGLALRRFVFTKFSPNPKSYESGLVALLIFLLMVTYLYTQSSGYVATSATAKANWWMHAGIIMIFPHLIIRSKHFHIILAPVNIFFRTERLSEILPLNLDMEALESSEDEIRLGLETLGDLSWKERLDFLSCVECRRCTDHCPANISEQELDPRGFILQGRKAVYTLADDQPVIGNVISEQALGQCTSCGACENICPVGIEHLQILTGAKRAQALATGTGMVATDYLQNVERTGNAFGNKAEMRKQLIEELDIPRFEKGKTEYLLWLGCVWAYNTDARSSLAAMVKILKAAGVNFGVLEHESCTGHHSRRQGEEMQFQALAEQNINELQRLQAAKIIAPCPHCLHTIGREYPELKDGFAPEIVHHSQFIARLIESGAIKMDGRSLKGKKTTYHDPCYLGRYEHVYREPRELIEKAGLRLVEMQRHGPKSMCCGGGSAGFIREQQVKKRVDQVRKEQVRETGAELLVVACPECKMMLNAAVSETQDLAELVAQTMTNSEGA